MARRETIDPEYTDSRGNPHGWVGHINCACPAGAHLGWIKFDPQSRTTSRRAYFDHATPWRCPNADTADGPTEALETVKGPVSESVAILSAGGTL